MCAPCITSVLSRHDQRVVSHICWAYPKSEPRVGRSQLDLNGKQREDRQRTRGRHCCCGDTPCRHSTSPRSREETAGTGHGVQALRQALCAFTTRKVVHLELWSRLRSSALDKQSFHVTLTASSHRERE